MVTSAWIHKHTVDTDRSKEKFSYLCGGAIIVYKDLLIFTNDLNDLVICLNGVVDPFHPLEICWQHPKSTTIHERSQNIAVGVILVLKQVAFN